MGKRKHTRSRENGAVGMAETGTIKATKTSTVGTAEMGATSVAREAAVGIAMSTTTSGSSRISVIKRTDMQNEWKLHQEVT